MNYNEVELDNYDGEYGSFLWPQNIIKRPYFTTKLYAPPISNPIPLPQEIVVRYKDTLSEIEKIEEQIEKATIAHEEAASNIKPETTAWGNYSKRSSREAENKRIAKDLEALLNNKQSLVEKLNFLKKDFDTTKQIVEIQTQLEQLYSK